jgi:hypothetical protein
MIEKLFFTLSRDIGRAIGSKAGSISKFTTSSASSSLTNDINELANYGLVSHEYLRGLIARARSKEQLGRILHYLDHNNTNNLTGNQWGDLRALVFERFKNMQLAKLLEHLDLIIMHIF